MQYCPSKAPPTLAFNSYTCHFKRIRPIKCPISFAGCMMQDGFPHRYKIAVAARRRESVQASVRKGPGSMPCPRPGSLARPAVPFLFPVAQQAWGLPRVKPQPPISACPAAQHRTCENGTTCFANASFKTSIERHTASKIYRQLLRLTA